MTGDSSANASGRQSVAAGHSIGVAITGDHAAPTFVQQMRLTLPAEAFKLPQVESSVVNLPQRPRHFVGREHELKALNRAFEDVGGIVVHAVHGLGGIGKSTLAAWWAEGRKSAYNPVWWITAETEADLDAGLADFTVALQPALRDGMSRTALRDLAVRWLAEHDNWLLVLDNVSEPAHVKRLLGRAVRGRILITTRQVAGWEGVAETLSLDVLELPEAVNLFTRIYGGTADEAEDLCRDLGCLPLAVDQAAAYCREAGITAAAFRRQLAKYPVETLNAAPEGGRAVARIWPVTLDRLADTPLAGEILRVIAWWAPSGIRREYLEPMGSPPEVTEALRRLAAHSMISLHHDTVSVHRLVQAVARGGGPAEVARARDTAAELLREWGEGHEGDLASGWLTHAETLVGLADAETEPVAALLVSIAVWHYYLDTYGDDEEARRWAERAVAATLRTCGRGAPEVLDARRLLADALGREGDWKGALATLRDNVTDCERAFGRKAPTTFEARASLARPMAQTGDAKGASRLAKRNLGRARRALGADHPTVIHISRSVVELYAKLVELGHDSYAPEGILYGRFLRSHAVDVEGEDATSTLYLTAALVRLLSCTGAHADALAILRPLVERCARVFGELNLRTLDLRVSQIDLMRRVGDLDGAREQAPRLLGDWEYALDGTPFSGYIREKYVDLLPGED
ncbi:tetratricopeptide repeat protein [Streptomyces sp. NPDC086519]|uniref:tetratricopeptide repeat protein n=1 Tax=Streptomyces sp. NPDC086519 TaxID=3154863 RepID=UPI00343CE289